MALKALILNHKRRRLQTERSAIPDRSAEFATRQAQLEQAIAEASNEEEEAVVTAEVEAFEQERDAHNAEITRLDGEIADLTRQIQELEADVPAAPPAADPIDPNHPTTAPPAERKDDNTMPNTRGRYFGMTRSQFGEFVKRESVSGWLSNIRTLANQERAVTGGEVTVPHDVVGLLRENVPMYSKLLKHVQVKRLPGTSRQNIMGTIPEGIWTEMYGKLNELNLTFGKVEADGYKVGGYIALPNALLKDSDVNLAQEIISALMKAIAKALDKAILYGTGTKMPYGIVPRLLAAAKPDSYNTTVPWTDLSSTHVFALGGKAGLELFQSLLACAGAISTKYGDGSLFWVMNRKTHMKLRAEAISVNAAGAIVAGMDNTMPIVGGTIEIVDDMPDDVIVGGVGGVYLAIEREGTIVDKSEHAFFIEDMTVFKGIARYDGKPVIGEAFVVISLGDTKPTANAVSFTQDTANAAS